MNDIIEREGTEYLVIGALPDAAEALEPGDRVVLNGLTVKADGEDYKIWADESEFAGWTDQEADTMEALVERHAGATDKKPASKPKTLVERVKGVFMNKDKAIGEGRGVGRPRQGVGGTDTCVCPNCGHEEKHDRGDPCAETKCPECGEPMKGKEEKEKKALADWAEELGDEAYKALLSHLAESERMTEAEAGLLAADELEGLVGAWLATEDGQKVGRRLRSEWVKGLTDWWDEVQETFGKWNDKITNFFRFAKYEDQQETMPDDWAALMAGSKSGFKSFRGRDGKWRWIAWAASAFEDREQEFFKTKALEEYVAEANERNDHGKLWFYHLPFYMGDGDFTALPGESRILVKMGTWADDPFAQKAAVYYSREDVDEGASVGYRYRPKDREDRVYNWLWIFETSPVPAEKAAFPFSRFDSFGGKQMIVTEDQKAKMREVFGDGWEEVLSRVESASKQMEEMGWAFKAAQERDGDLVSTLSELLADEAIAEKAKANPVQMLKLALGKIKDEAAKGLVQKVIDALEKGGYEYPKPEKKVEGKDKEEEEYGKPKKEKADEEEENEEKYPKPKKGKKEADVESLPVTLEVEGLPELVDAVKQTMAKVEQQGEEIAGLKAMLDTDDDERARQKLNKATKVVAYKASIAGLLDDKDEEGDQEKAVKMSADHPLARLSIGTPLGPRGG